MRQHHSTAGFDLPHVPESDKLRRVLSSTMSRKDMTLSRSYPETLTEGRYPYWNSEHFSLQNAKVFQNASQKQQQEILQLANLGLLQEAYFIEKAGVGYMAKMVLLAETTEERMLYALFSADEVYHLAQIMHFLPQPPSVETKDTFLRFLADLIENQDKTAIVFILQVVLEGWGLSHYRNLSKDCQDAELSQVLRSFLQDESRHHASGVTLFNQISLSASSREVIVEALTIFLQMVQAGPQRVVAAVETVLGHLSRQQKIKLFEELDTQTHSGNRLALLRSLMRGKGAESIVQKLEERGVFQPFPAYRCV